VVEIVPDLEMATMESTVFAMKEDDAHADPWPEIIQNS
jgi:hypothetical protein